MSDRIVRVIAAYESLRGLTVNSICKVIDGPFVTIESKFNESICSLVEPSVNISACSPCESSKDCISPALSFGSVLVANRSSGHIALISKLLILQS